MGGVAELIEIISNDILKLRRELTGLRPFTLLAEPDLARYGWNAFACM
jgi:hypothetical protein